MERKGLREAIRGLKGPARKQVEVTSAVPFETSVQQRMEDLEKQVEELKSRVNGLLFTLVGAVAVNVVLGILR